MCKPIQILKDSFHHKCIIPAVVLCVAWICYLSSLSRPAARRWGSPVFAYQAVCLLLVAYSTQITIRRALQSRLPRQETYVRYLCYQLRTRQDNYTDRKEIILCGKRAQYGKRVQTLVMALCMSPSRSLIAQMILPLGTVLKIHALVSKLLLSFILKRQ